MTPDLAYDDGRVGYRTGMRREACFMPGSEVPARVRAYWQRGWDEEAAGLPVPPYSIAR
jgi:hypothetical protein